MPIIDFSDVGGIAAEFSGATDISATLSSYVRPALRHFDGSTVITASLSTILEAVAQFDGATDIEAFLRLNGEPNILPSVNIPGSSVVDFGGVTTLGLFAQFNGSTAISISADHIEAEVFSLDIILDIVPTSVLPGSYSAKEPRLKVDGVEVPIRRASANSPEASAGVELTVTLARPGDKSLFGPNSVIDFGLGVKSAGVWDEASFDNLIENGVYKSYQFGIGWAGAGPSDSVDVTFGSNLSEGLIKTAARDLIIYDDLRESVDVSSIETLYDTQGRAYLTEVKAISGMKIFDLFHEVFVTRCGFTAYKTNIPNFPVKRYNCGIGESFFNALKGYVGMFSPAIYLKDDTVWIVDTTMALPSGFPAPRELATSDYISLSTNTQRNRLDALLVSYSELKNQYDYTTFRYEDTTKGTNPVITTHKIFIEFRRNSQPYVVVREALNSSTTEVELNGVVISTTEENLIYGGSGELVSRRLLKYMRLPDLDASSPGDVVFTDQLALEEQEDYVYAAHPFRPREKYLAEKTMRQTGLILLDADNQQLGSDFASQFPISLRSGNVDFGMQTYTAPIQTRHEVSLPLRTGQVRTKILEIDEIHQVVSNDYVEERPGDAGISNLVESTSRVLVFDQDNLDRSTDRIDKIHMGELSVIYSIPLARRILINRKSKGRTGELENFAYDPTIDKGSLVTALGRGETLGTFIVLGWSVQADINGVITRYTAREI